jgi:hypothetical protein
MVQIEISYFMGGDLTLDFSEFSKNLYKKLSGLTSQAKFIGALFNAAGSDFFELNPTYGTDGYQRKVFNGTRSLTQDMKDSFPKPIDTKKLMNFFQTRIGDKTLPDIMENFDIHKNELQDKELLCIALCTQFQNIVLDVSDVVDNIVPSEYIGLLRASDIGASKNAPYCFRDDFCVINESPEVKHTLSFYQDFEHLWTIKNTGKVTWEYRYLEFTNQSDIRIKAKNKIIKIPKVKPGDEICLKAEFNSRGFEGDYDALWEMKDIDGNLCFPNKETQLRVVVTVSNGDENRLEA